MSNPDDIDGSENAVTAEDLCWVAEQLPSQARFLDSGARFKGFSGPVGSGKSAALCAQAIILSHVNGGRDRNPCRSYPGDVA